MKRLLLILTLWAGPLAAQDSGSAAQAAADALQNAAIGLDQADSARDRVAALTETVRAYEDGLTAMREGLRAAAIREKELTLKLQGQEDEMQQLLGVLTSIGTSATPLTMFHPQGPIGAARSGMLVASVSPGLAKQVEALRADLQEVTELRQLQENAAGILEEGLAGAQEARIALSKAVADRTDLPRRFAQDPIKTEILISSTETLEAFASGLLQMPQEEAAMPIAAVDHQKGSITMPVRGVVLRRAGEPDAAGVARPGLVVATEPQALVTSPFAATIRYSGPLLDYGLVTILEPQAGLLFVFAGLDTVFGSSGQVVPKDSPLGTMGGAREMNNLSSSGEGAGVGRSETLYIEVREGDAPVDPLQWFAIDKG